MPEPDSTTARLVAASWFVGVAGGALVLYWYLIRPGISTATLAEVAAFDRSVTPFLVYATSAVGCLLLGPAAIHKAISLQQPAVWFGLACLACAWSGVWLASETGDTGIGGITIHFYWWGLALTWTFIVAVIYLAHARAKPLVVRDWTLYAYGLALLPILIIASFPLWRRADIMDADQAMVTTVTIAFAGVFVFVHWFIFEILDRRRP